MDGGCWSCLRTANNVRSFPSSSRYSRTVLWRRRIQTEVSLNAAAASLENPELSLPIRVLPARAIRGDFMAWRRPCYGEAREEMAGAGLLMVVGFVDGIEAFHRVLNAVLAGDMTSEALSNREQGISFFFFALSRA